MRGRSTADTISVTNNEKRNVFVQHFSKNYEYISLSIQEIFPNWCISDIVSLFDLRIKDVEMVFFPWENPN